MTPIEAIYHRRAIKGFDPDHTLPAEDERRLLEAMIQAPTSFNIQHWRPVILRDPDLRARFRSEIGNDQPQITDASLLVLFTADVKAWEKEPERYWKDAPTEVAEMLVGWLGDFHQDREWLQRDEAQRSIGIAMATLMIAAQELGYDSCPMIGFDLDAAADWIRLPKDHVIGPLVAIGKRTQEPWPKPGQLPLEEIVVEDRFPA